MFLLMFSEPNFYKENNTFRLEVRQSIKYAYLPDSADQHSEHPDQAHFQSGDNIPLWEFPQHQAEISIHQVVYFLRSVDSWDITQLRGDRRVEAHEARDGTPFPGQNLSSSAAAGRLITGNNTCFHTAMEVIKIRLMVSLWSSKQFKHASF